MKTMRESGDGKQKVTLAIFATLIHLIHLIHLAPQGERAGEWLHSIPISMSRDLLRKQGHRHKSRALVRENVKTCENL